jgi:hypothetical protein
VLVKIKKSNNILYNKELKQNFIAKVNAMNEKMGLNHKYIPLPNWKYFKWLMIQHKGNYIF